MATKERKISFSTLFKKVWATHDFEDLPELTDLLKYIKKKKKLDRKVDLKDSKFYFLDTCTFVSKEPLITGYFTSAKYNFRPNLIDGETGDERPSPKKLQEGEKEKTHFTIKIGAKEIFIALEQNGNGVTIGQIVNYLNKFLRDYLSSLNKPRNFSIDYAQIGENDFLTTLNNLKRVRVAKVFMDKSLLGSGFLNFSNRTFSVQSDIVITATAESGNSIKNAAIDIFNASQKNNSVSNVRIYGNDQNGTNVVMDTSFIEKVDSLNLTLNPTTGEVQTTEVLSGLKALIKSFN